MVTKVDLKICLSGLSGISERVAIAVSIYCPSSFAGSTRQSVVFALPGGGYTREYYDLQVRGRDGYSMARHLANDGHIVVSCDPLGVGGSSTPDIPNSLNPELLALANHAAVDQILERIRSGSLIDEIPPLSDLYSVGLGHSMGAGITLAQQAKYASYDAIALLGGCAPTSFSAAMRTTKNMVDGLTKVQQARSILTSKNGGCSWTSDVSDRTSVRSLYEFFIASSVPDDVVTVDAALYWTERINQQGQDAAVQKAGIPGTRLASLPHRLKILYALPRLAAAHRIHKKYFKKIDVPVFLGYGERDVSLEPHRDATAFTSSADVNVYVLPDSSHCHNYSNSRTLLFQKLSFWITSICQSSLAITN